MMAEPYKLAAGAADNGVFLQELCNIPVIASAAQKVTTAHKSLCTTVPLYGQVSSAAISFTLSFVHTAHQYNLVKASVKKAEGLGLHVITTLRKDYPIVEKPTEEVVEAVSKSARKVTLLGASCAVTTVVNQSCWLTEAFICTVEKTCAAIIRKEEEVSARLVQEAHRLKCLSPIHFLIYVERCLRSSRLAVQAWRCSGTSSNIATNLKPRKVTRRKSVSTKNKCKWTIMIRRAISWLNKFSLGTFVHPENEHSKGTRQEPAEESSEESTEEEYYRSMFSREQLNRPLEDYFNSEDDEDSSDDPDYTTGTSAGSTTDSLEYRSTVHEESENSFIEELIGTHKAFKEKYLEESAVGEVVPDGMAVGEVVPDGMAVGEVVPDGMAVGEVVPDGMAVGEVVPDGMAVGEVVPDGMAVGEVVPDGMTVGEVVPDGMAVGEVVPDGMAVGEVVPDGMAVGEVVPDGMAVGEVVPDGMAVGEVVSDGMAVGEVVPDGMAVGEVVPEGSAGGEVAPEGSAGGEVVPEGSAGGEVVPDGMTGGEVAQEGAAGGEVAQEGAAGGEVAQEGAAGGEVVPDGSAGGEAAPEGSAGGEVAPEGSAGGEVAPEGSAGGEVAPEGSGQD
nr:uncharacterized protein LOC123760043 isoform X3 [Procambarus clarkii]